MSAEEQGALTGPLLYAGPMVDTALPPAPNNLGNGHVDHHVTLATAINVLQAVPLVLTDVAGALVLDLDEALSADRMCSAAVNLTITTSNRALGRGCNLRLHNSSGGAISLTWPAWIPYGAALPVTLAAGKRLIISIKAYGTLDTEIDAACSVQP